MLDLLIYIFVILYLKLLELSKIFYTPATGLLFSWCSLINIHLGEKLDCIE